MKKELFTKEEAGYVWSYNHARWTTLSECYSSSYSTTKKEIEEEIREFMYGMGGYGFRIFSRNSSFFSCAFKFTDDDGLEHLMVFKPKKWWIDIPLEYIDDETGAIEERR